MLSTYERSTFPLSWKDMKNFRESCRSIKWPQKRVKNGNGKAAEWIEGDRDKKRKREKETGSDRETERQRDRETERDREKERETEKKGKERGQRMETQTEWQSKKTYFSRKYD